jgi:hypothetical protein
MREQFFIGFPLISERDRAVRLASERGTLVPCFDVASFYTHRFVEKSWQVHGLRNRVLKHTARKAAWQHPT